MAEMSSCAGCDSGIEETAKYAFFHCRRIRALWANVGAVTARIDSKPLVQLEVSYVVDNIDPSWVGVKRRVFLVIQAVTRMA